MYKLVLQDLIFFREKIKLAFFVYKTECVKGKKVTLLHNTKT